MFHVSHLCKYMHDPSLIVEESQQEELEIEPNLSILRQPVYIVEHDTKKLRTKIVKLVKVQWSDDAWDETWETKDGVRESYPKLLLY